VIKITSKEQRFIITMFKWNLILIKVIKSKSIFKSRKNDFLTLDLQLLFLPYNLQNMCLFVHN